MCWPSTFVATAKAADTRPRSVFSKGRILLAAESYLRGRCPHQPLLLAGISLGAAVSLQALPRLPDVRGVWSEGAFARFGNAVDYKFSVLPNFLRAPLIDAYCVLGWLDCRLWVPSINPLDCLDGTTPPIFFCHGERDELVPLREGRMLYESYRGPKQHWWVSGASHYNVRQRNHAEYLYRLRYFSRRLSLLSTRLDAERIWPVRPVSCRSNPIRAASRRTHESHLQQLALPHSPARRARARWR